MQKSEHYDDTVRLLGDLVAYPTISADSNLALIDFAAGLLETAGARVTVSANENGEKANLFATLGPDDDDGVILSGHTDVVPVAGQDWSSDPFKLDVRDGNYYARGACDMKGFIACTLALVPLFGAAKLTRPVHFCFTHDEETGCLGARALTGELAARGLKASAAIIGEPTMMGIIEGHKGCHEYTTEIRGLEGHGSLPHMGINAIEFAVRYVAKLMELRESLKNSTPKASRFVPPYTTLQIGRINGGVAHNVIAGNCTVEWELRPVQAGDTQFIKQHIGDFVDQELLPQMRAVAPLATIATRTLGEVDGLEPVSDSQARAIVAELTGGKEVGLVSFGTEAGLFQKIGIPAVVCGPGSIEQAHKADEFVSADQLNSCLGMLERLVGKLAT